MARIVVVGAGVGGLAAAARLAALRHEVTVVEAAETVGGKLGSFSRTTSAGTFRFDTGPTLLTLPEIFEELFEATGEPLEKSLTLQAVDPVARYRFANGTVVTTTRDLDEQAARFEQAFGSGAGAAWSALIGRGERMWDGVERPVLFNGFSARGVLPRLARFGDVASIGPGLSLRALGKRLFDDPRQRMMLDRYATYAGSDPRRAPAALAVLPYLESAFGAWHIEGGLNRLASALEERILDRGGQIRTNARVAQISTSGGRVDGVRLVDGTWFPADVVVSNADAAALYGRLVEPRPRFVPSADSMSGFVILLGVRGRTPNLAHHNVLFSGADYDVEFDSIFGRPARPVTDPVVYISAPDDPGLRPYGHETWLVMVNAPRHGRDGERGALDWDAPGLASGYAERVISLLAARGMPVRERIVFSQVITPADLQRRTGAPGGAIYGAALHGLRSSLVRPGNRSKLRGLYLVGGSTHPGGGLPLVALSARITSGLIGPA